MKESSTPRFSVIAGGRKHLENAVMKQMAEGNLSRDLLERLKPQGDLKLVYSRPADSMDGDEDWLNLEDLNC